MAFLQSWMLWGLLAVGVPIAIHLIHRRKAIRVPFPAIEFILRSRKAVAKRFRIKQLVLLALRCLMVAAAAVAAARPLFPGRDAAIGPSGGPAAVAICVDVSLSMRTRIGTSDKETAFAAAKDAALSLVEKLGPDVEGVVIAFGDDAKTTPTVPTADKHVLREAIGALAPTWGRTNLQRALDAGSAAIGSSSKPKKLVYLFTDGAAPGWKDVSPRDPASGIGWRIIDVTGKTVSNTALASLDVHEESSGAIARAEIASFSATASPGTSVELLLGGKSMGRNFVDLGAGAEQATSFTLGTAPPGLNSATARLAGDSLVEDDVRYAVFRGRARVRTLLVDGEPKTTIRDAETFYLERALAPSREATATVAPVVVDVEGLSHANLAAFDVVVLANVGTLPATIVGSLKRWVEAGGGLLVTAGDRVEAEEANANLGELLPMRLRGTHSTHTVHTEGGMSEGASVTLAPPPVAHPITAALDAAAVEVLGGIHFKSTELLEGQGAEESAEKRATVFLKFSDGTPAFVERAMGRGRIAFFASSIDRDWTDFPISTDYLPLMRRTVRYLAGELSDNAATDVRVGHSVKIEVGERAAVRVEGPEGFAPQRLTAADGAVEVTPSIPGVYRVVRDDGTPDERLAGKAFAANVDVSESDLRKVSRADLSRIFAGTDFDVAGALDAEGTVAKSAVPDRPMWESLLSLGAIALVLEGVVTGL